MLTWRWYGDRPIREASVRRLVDGGIAEWIIVPCGDDAQDAAARVLLSGRCGEIERTAMLPDPKAAPMDHGDSLPAFTGRYPRPVLHLAQFEPDRSDPAEASLREQILHLEPSLAHETGPIAVAVFGRGRALTPLHGVTLTQVAIDDACMFLLGSCSCEVKEQRPGTTC